MKLFRRARKAPDARRTEASIPDGQRIYAVGDLHGRHDLFGKMRDLIAADLALHPIGHAHTVFLGDYVDRGPDSSKVLDELTGEPFPTSTIMLRGNHEEMLLSFLTDASTAEHWRHNGGLETLLSYNIDVREFRRGKMVDRAAAELRERLPQAHLKFLHQLRLSHAVGGYFFCHAGARPGVPLDAQLPTDLLWIRDEFLFTEYDFGKIVVHGHSPVRAPEVRSNRINVDTGAYISNLLTCLVLEGEERRFLSAQAR